MPTLQRTARIAGALYLVTIVTSIPALALKDPALNDPDFVLGSGGESGLLLAGLLEMILALACIGTAVVLFPVARRQSEIAALGFVGARVLEASLIVLGVVSMLSLVTLRQHAAGADADALAAGGMSLVAVHDWAFLLGPGLIPAVNAGLLGYVMYRSGLVPRIIPAVGLVGAPLLAASATASLFGVLDQVSTLAAIAALPVALWEISLGLWLVTKGFRPDALVRLGAVRGPDAAAERAAGLAGT